MAKVQRMLRELDLLGFAAVTVDRDGYVHSTNGRANQLFDEELFVKSGRLYASDALSREKLQEVLQHIRAESGPETLRVVIARSHRRPLVIDAVRPGATGDFRLSPSEALLLLTDIDERRVVSREFAGEIFGLTISQAKVAASLAEGKALAAIAQEMGISAGTARNHLKQIFERTGTRRQGELVSLLSRLLR